LKKHYKSEKEIWLVYYKKHTGKPRIPYNEAVEEALCFGWIDSIVKSIDDDRFAQRFSVRNPKRPYSQANKERFRALVKQGKVAKDVLATLGDLDLTEKEFEIPRDILKAMRQISRPGKTFKDSRRPTYEFVSPSLTEHETGPRSSRSAWSTSFG
jgi:uncharacterized protein YdeI (YjbR/CyaY-like superfamily)